MFKKMFDMFNKSYDGQISVATSTDNFNDFFNGLANQLGVKRYSKEYDRYLWDIILGALDEDLKENNR